MIAPAHVGENLRELLWGASDGAFVGGDYRRIVLWNQAATNITGYSATEALGRSCCDLFAKHDDAAGCLHDGTAVMTARATSVRAFDVYTATKAGRPLWLHLTVFPVRACKGAALTVHLFRDVTPTRQLVAQVRERVAASDDEPDTATRGDGALTLRQLEVLRLAALGLNTAAIAGRLHISRATVRNHVQNVFWKLEVHNRLQAVAYAARHGLL